MQGINDFDFSRKISKDEILIFLKREATKISINDVMMATVFLIVDAKYVQSGYREKYIELYAQAFLTRIKEMKDDKNIYEDDVDPAELLEAIELLEEQESHLGSIEGFDPSFFKIYKVISIYTTFVIDEPVHPVGTPFPGGFQVKYEDGKYLCPVKEKQKDNPGAVCGFCIAEQDKDVLQ
jgi:uncharacterized protein (UPF0305 family)